jgi:hypothetical protein
MSTYFDQEIQLLNHVSYSNPRRKHLLSYLVCNARVDAMVNSIKEDFSDTDFAKNVLDVLNLIFITIELIVAISLIAVTSSQCYSTQGFFYIKLIAISHVMCIVLVMIRPRITPWIKEVTVLTHPLVLEYQKKHPRAFHDESEEYLKYQLYSLVVKRYVLHKLLVILSYAHAGFSYVLFLVTAKREDDICDNNIDLFLRVYVSARAIIFILILLAILFSIMYIVIIIYFDMLLQRRRGASQIMLDRLCVTEYKENISGVSDCVICLLEYNPRDRIITLQCQERHFFHENCARKWLKTNATCPICRANI